MFVLVKAVSTYYTSNIKKHQILKNIFIKNKSLKNFKTMKNNLTMKSLYVIAFLCIQTTYIMAQCPTFINDGGGDGTVYYMTLADGATECANYSADITINGVTYEFPDCNNVDEVEFTIATGGTGTAVIIANDAPITIVNGATTCTYDASGNLVALPVELLSFEGEVRENGTYLTWQTASEENNAGFEIQRSLDGKVFETLSFVEGNGNAVEIMNYEYLDNQPFEGTNYYRLKQMDFDGVLEYSHIVSVKYEVGEAKTLSISPNPVQNQLAVTNGTGQATIYNILGQPMSVLIIKDKVLTIDVSDLAKGQYILSICKEDGSVVTKRFVK